MGGALDVMELSGKAGCCPVENKEHVKEKEVMRKIFINMHAERRATLFRAKC
jgi:hypothetical protein